MRSPLLGHVNDRWGDITSAADDALVVESAAVGKQEIDLEGIVFDAGEHALDRVSLIFVTADVSHRQRHRLPVRDDVRRAVAVAGRSPVLRSHRTEFAFLSMVLAVVGIVDEVDGDGSRPVRVENRHGEPCEQKVGNDLKPLTVECVEPPQDSVVTRRSLGIVAGVPNRVLVSAG